MSNMREVTESKVVALIGDIRHIELEEYDFVSISNAFDKAANFLEVLLTNRHDLMRRISFLEGMLAGIDMMHTEGTDEEEDIEAMQ